jgi:hypothetical protein
MVNGEERTIDESCRTMTHTHTHTRCTCRRNKKLATVSEHCLIVVDDQDNEQIRQVIDHIIDTLLLLSLAVTVR